MTEKKRRGSGQATKRKDGRWQASYVTNSGKRLYFYGDTQAEANKKKRQAEMEDERGMLATGPDMLLCAYLENWLETAKKPPIVRVSTYDKYKWYLKKYINPALGHIRLRALSPQHVQSFYSQKLEEGLSPGTVRNFHLLLHSAMKNAVKWNLVSRNVVALVTRPSEGHHEAQVLTIEQARNLIETAKQHKVWSLLVVALSTGMRRGELLALRWDDVDFQVGKLFVRHAVSKLNGRGYVEHEPKTKKGRRTIVLPSSVVDVLREHREYVEQVRCDAGDSWLDLGLVFPNTRGNFIELAKLWHMLDKVVKQAGLPHMRFHDLRHSAATIMLAMGIHPKVVQEILGHSSISITMDLYSHVLPSVQHEAAGKVDDVLRGSLKRDVKNDVRTTSDDEVNR
jgi:integrase